MAIPTVTAGALLRKIPACDDSVVTAQLLQPLGYTNVHHHAGGKDEWRDAGLPLERAGRPFVPR